MYDIQLQWTYIIRWNLCHEREIENRLERIVTNRYDKTIREQRKKVVKQTIKITLSFREIFSKSFVCMLVDDLYIKFGFKCKIFTWSKTKNIFKSMKYNKTKPKKKNQYSMRLYEWPFSVLKYHNNINEKNCSHNCVRRNIVFFFIFIFLLSIVSIQYSA